MRTKGTAAELEQRRRIAGRLLLQGHKLQDVAEAVGVSLTSVKRRKKAVREGGLDALAAQPQPGRKPRLSPAQIQQLRKLLLAGPRQAGYRTELWTCSRVAQVIAKQFRVDYHPSHVWKLLRALGWTCQKPEQTAREQDEEAVRHWRQHRWPALKKKRARAD